MTTPTITNVTGTISTGQILAITGTTMVDQNTSSWDSWFTSTNPNASSFEGSRLTADGYGASAGTYTGSEYVTDIRVLGSKSVHYQLTGQYTRQINGSGMPSPWIDWDVAPSKSGTTWTDVYLRGYLRWVNNSWPGAFNGPGAQGAHDLKIWWLQGGTHGYFMSIECNNDGSAPTQFLIHDNSGDPTQFGNFPSGALQQSRWYCFEAHFKIHGNSPYTTEFWVDGTRIINHAFAEGVDPNPGGWGWESFTNLYDSPAGWVWDQWHDGFAVSQARINPASIIEIGNNATYASANPVYQAPYSDGTHAALSDSSSYATCDLTGLGAGPYWMWVTNNRGERSEAFPLLTFLFSEGFESAISENTRDWFDVNGTPQIDTSVFSPNGGSGSLRFDFNSGVTTPASPKRHLLNQAGTSYERVQVSYDIKYGSASQTWLGPTTSYHPHIIQLLTDANNEWDGPAISYLSARFEMWNTFKPVFNFQDGLRINTGQLGVNLLGTATAHAIAGGNGIQTGSNATYWFDDPDYWNDAYFAGSNNDMVNNTWHHIDCYIAMNSISGGVPQADGVLKYWVDGALKIDQTDLYFRTAQYATQKFKTLLLVPYMEAPRTGINQKVWVDNLVVSGGQLEEEEGGIDGIAPFSFGQSAQLRGKGRLLGPANMTFGQTAVLRWVGLITALGDITFTVSGNAGAELQLVQEGFRWRNDDGSEAAATWKASQDTNVSITLSSPIRVRVLVDLTGSLNPYRYRLEYKKTTETAYRQVLSSAGSLRLSESSNITASGETTTAQLSPPASKTVGDFSPGRIWDDENGLDSISIEQSEYTELEWCIVAHPSESAVGEIYNLRVTRAA